MLSDTITDGNGPSEMAECDTEPNVGPRDSEQAGASISILVADDEDVTRLKLKGLLSRSGYEVVTASDGQEAWEILERSTAPILAILDWMMPGLDGLEICRKVRSSGRKQPTYLILLTSRDAKEDIVKGLRGGADDYITKPFSREELEARVQVGVRMVELQRMLGERVHELEAALEEITQLRGLLPICMYCKKVRNDQSYWEQIDQYLTLRSPVRFSHGICPDCWKKEVEPQLSSLAEKART